MDGFKQIQKKIFWSHILLMAGTSATGVGMLASKEVFIAIPDQGINSRGTTNSTTRHF